MTLVLALMTSFALVLANAFFVASEFALVKMRPSQLTALVGKKVRGAKTAQAISEKLDAYLSANQLGITLASLALGWIGEPVFTELMTHVLGPLEGWTGTAAHSVAVAAGFVTITFLHVVLGELAPKSLAIQRTAVVALWTATPLRVFYIAAFPIIWAFNGAARLVLLMFGLKPASESEKVHSPEELRIVLREAEIEPGPRKLIDRIFDYTHRVARHIMTLRRDVVVLRARAPFDESVQVALNNQFSRYPVLEDDSSVVGYVHFKDITAGLVAADRPADVRAILREPIEIDETTPIEEIRRRLLRTRVHMAIVRDAEKRFVGLVTLEDLLEEFVGEIRDEQDVEEVAPISGRPDGGIELDARLTLDVVARELGVELEDAPAEVETLAGYLRVRLGGGRVPTGARTRSGKLELEVIETREGIVRRVLVTKGPALASEEA
jgi:CBS domain containing-hemolysin-like protein